MLPTRVQRGIDPFEMAQREFDNMLGRFVGSRLMDNDASLAPFAVDVREDGDHLYVEADMPGFKKDEVDINVENQTLTISAEHRDDDKSDNKDKGEWHLRERRYTRFQRSFTLPPTIDTQSVQARLNDGVLTVTLTKREETKPRKIAVS